MRRLLRTSSFRLTLLYAALFGVSVLILFGVIYWSTAGSMASQLDAQLDAELTSLEAEARDGDLAGSIGARLARRPAPAAVYALRDPSGRVVAGNLPDPPIQPGTTMLGQLGIDGERQPVRARTVRLSDGSLLTAGVDAFQLEEMQELITRAFGWGAGATLALALLGGAVMSASLLTRVEAIARTSRAIMDGDLGRRVPTRHTDDEFDHLAANINAMLDRIEALVDGLAQVTNDIAHDLRSPLTRLRHRIEQARAEPDLTEAQRARLEPIVAEADAILDTFGALLRIAQIEAGTRRAAFARVDLSALLLNLAEVYEPVADEAERTLVAGVAPGLAVQGDRELLTQMAANLVENAIRHTPPGTRITLTAAHAAEGEIRLAVADDGPGIPETERDKVLQRFYRLEASRTTPGSGLGLSLVAAIAALHGARLTLADNQPGLRVEVGFT